MSKECLKNDGARLNIYLDGPLWDGQPCATIGDFSSNCAESGLALLNHAIDRITAVGIDRIIGPMAGDTWHSYRFVTGSDGTPPFLMEPTNKPHEPDVFQSAGFREISRYFSARVPIAQAAQTVPPSDDGVEIETWDGTDPEGLFRQVFELSVSAFANNAFYKPISEADFLGMYMPVIPMIKKELILFARRPDGTLAGFLFGIPNYAEGPLPKAAILKTYASLVRGAGRQLAYRFHKAALELGYETAIHALIHDHNQSADRSAAEGATLFRHYSLFGLRLNG